MLGLYHTFSSAFLYERRINKIWPMKFWIRRKNVINHLALRCRTKHMDLSGKTLKVINFLNALHISQCIWIVFIWILSTLPYLNCNETQQYKYSNFYMLFSINKLRKHSIDTGCTNKNINKWNFVFAIFQLKNHRNLKILVTTPHNY